MRLLSFVIVLVLILTGCNYVDLQKLTTGYAGYCEILKKYEKYDTLGVDDTIKFVYKTNSEYLNQLKLEPSFPKSLDSLSEIDKIIKLKTWLSETLNYEYGYSGKDGRTFCKPRNLIEMLSRKSDLSTVFVCRDFGIALSELYLSIGLKARYITCLSVFQNDNDVHVVTEVYWNDEQKWIMMDAAFNTYITKENGEILGLEELRNCFISKEKMEVNKSIRIISSSAYLKYMAKSSFKFMRPVRSEFDVENTNCKHVLLLPLNYNEKIYSDSEKILIMNNSGQFWE